MLEGCVPALWYVTPFAKRRQNVQSEAGALAETVDIMLVVGGKNSANTKKLADIAGEKGAATYIIEDAAEIDKIKNEINNLEGKMIGVTAGASTPDWIIEEVMEKMKEDIVMEEKNMEVATSEETMEKSGGNHGRTGCS